MLMYLRFPRVYLGIFPENVMLWKPAASLCDLVSSSVKQLSHLIYVSEYRSMYIVHMYMFIIMCI